MSDTIEIGASQPSVKISSTDTIEVDSKLPKTEVDVSNSVTAVVQPDNYVIASEGMFGTSSGGAPQWILDAIQQQLTTGDGNLQSVLEDLIALTSDLQLGINQNLQQIQTAQTSISTLETSVNSKIDQNQASMLDIVATKVTDAEAQAISTNVLNTRFNNNVDAYIANLASVYTSPTSATATNISTLQTSYNDQTARIDGIEYATTDAFGYSLGASKLGTAPDGSIVGWQFTDGTGVQSEFKIQAQNFSISDGVTGKVPFSIVTNPDLTTDISFNGVVSFSNVTNSDSILLTGDAAADVNANTTTINGSSITTGSITTNHISTSGLDAAVITSGVIYNTGGSAETYTMKVDFNNGEIHIK